jgi:hypothetical protein
MHDVQETEGKKGAAPITMFLLREKISKNSKILYLCAGQLFADFRFSQNALKPNPGEKRGLIVYLFALYLV